MQHPLQFKLLLTFTVSIGLQHYFWTAVTAYDLVYRCPFSRWLIDGSSTSPRTAAENQDRSIRQYSTYSATRRNDGTPPRNKNASCCWVQLDGEWYDLREFADQFHSDGSQLLRRHAGQDISSLFYSNHFDGFAAKKRRLQQYKQSTTTTTTTRVIPSSMILPKPEQPILCSDQYLQLKKEVKAALEIVFLADDETETASSMNATRKTTTLPMWCRSRFLLRPLLVRYGVLTAAAVLARAPASSSSVILDGGTTSDHELLTVTITVTATYIFLSALYGILIGRSMWTHGHTAVHDPDAVSVAPSSLWPWPWMMNIVLNFDLAMIPSLWMLEHHAHHAQTNTAEDPDTRWFMPIIDYRNHAIRMMTTKTTTDTTCTETTAGTLEVPKQGWDFPSVLIPVLIYPFLVPFMACKATWYAIRFDPDGIKYACLALIIAPVRFSIDLWLLQPLGLVVAVLAATVYLQGTFIATHAAGVQNYHNASLYEATGDFLLDQLSSTNNVAPTNTLFSAFCGGINCHIEHHLFPNIAPELLPYIAPVVEQFAKRNNLPYHSYDHPAELWHDHWQFLNNKEEQ